jgi:nucleoside-diphosphate-sugar epimerase
MSRHLVLGSSGQIGGHLCEYLLSKDEQFERFDILDSSDFDLRIQDNRHLIEAVERCDIVYFLAFDVGGARYLAKNQDTSSFISNNMKIMSNTFDVLSRQKKKFIFASSQMAYMKDSSYGSLKRLGEKIAIDLGGVVTRFWNVYGIENDYTKSHVITDLVRCGIKNGKINVLTEGKEVRQFLFADDCSECLFDVGRKIDTFSRRSLDVSCFEWTPISRIAEIISKNLDDIEIEYGNLVDGLQTLDPIEPSREILSFWKPKTSIELGIEKIVQHEKLLSSVSV